MNFNQWVQSRLTAHGFSPGPIDGKIGEKTVEAIDAFQTYRNIPVTGVIDRVTEAALRLSSSVVSDAVKRAIPDRDMPVQIKYGVKPVWPTQDDVVPFYGPVGTNQTQVEIPFDMWLAWSKSTRVRRMTLHNRVAASAERVLQKIATTYSFNERKELGIDLFGGSLNVRKMRGGSRYSMHSWGIAIDFDPERNQLSWPATKARLAQPDAVPFWKAWEDEGWLSLGRARNFDWMHVQAARL